MSAFYEVAGDPDPVPTVQSFLDAAAALEDRVGIITPIDPR
jgi:hypothetical protein